MRTKEQTRKLINTVKEALRHPYAFPGGYSKTLVFCDGELAKASTAKNSWREILQGIKEGRRGWNVECVEIYWEGPVFFDALTGEWVESEYGDPEASA